jgi:CheY-like chemotaxis protein
MQEFPSKGEWFRKLAVKYLKVAKFATLAYLGAFYRVMRTQEPSNDQSHPSNVEPGDRHRNRSPDVVSCAPNEWGMDAPVERNSGHPLAALSYSQSRVGPRILVVEDDFLQSILIREALSNAGFNVVGIARDAEQADELASLHRPDLAVMDIHLTHGQDGVNAASVLRRRFHIPTIFATAQFDYETRFRAEAAHPLGWLRKPFTRDALVTTVIKALEAARKAELAHSSHGLRALENPRQGS